MYLAGLLKGNLFRLFVNTDNFHQVSFKIREQANALAEREYISTVDRTMNHRTLSKKIECAAVPFLGIFEKVVAGQTGPENQDFRQTDAVESGDESQSR